MTSEALRATDSDESPDGPPGRGSGAGHGLGHRAGADHRSLAAALYPMLAETCEGRLGPISWFKADWQRGGAATGNATYRTDDGDEIAVVVKLPVVPRERVWLNRLQNGGDPTPVVPRLFASGTTLGDYDLAWVVMERFEHGPLGMRWNDGHVARIAEAAARFHERASAFAVDEPPRIEPWDDLLADALAILRVNRVPEAKRWTTAIKSLRHALDPLVETWRARDVGAWLHGDLHFANAMSRTDLDDGPVCLIDLAEVHAGHWVEDAVYFERQLWARPERLRPTKPVRAIVAARRARGLPVEENYPRLVTIRRAFLAGTALHFIRSEGHPQHLDACLDWLERSLIELK